MYNLPLFETVGQYDDYISQIKATPPKKINPQKVNATTKKIFGESTHSQKKQKKDPLLEALKSYIMDSLKTNDVKTIANDKLSILIGEYINSKMNKMKIKNPENFWSIVFHAYKKKMMSSACADCHEDNSPWEEINEVLKRYKFSHRIKMREGLNASK